MTVPHQVSNAIYVSAVHSGITYTET